MDQSSIRENLKNSVTSAVDVLLRRDKFITTDGGPGPQEYRFKQRFLDAYDYAVLIGAIELTDMMVEDSPFIAEWYKAIILGDHELTDSAAMLAGILMECVNEPAEAHRIIHHFTK